MAKIFPLTVRFFDGAYYSNGKKFSVPEGRRDVSDYVTNVSWSYMTTAPYEAIDLQLAVPIEHVPAVFPPNGGVSGKGSWDVSTGFWVTVNATPAIGAVGEHGRLLAWGRADNVNIGFMANPKTGALFCQASVSISSWTSFLADAQVHISDFKLRGTEYDRGQFFFDGKAMGSLWEGFRAASDNLAGLSLFEDPVTPPPADEHPELDELFGDGKKKKKKTSTGLGADQVSWDQILRGGDSRGVSPQSLGSALSALWGVLANRVPIPRSLGTKEKQFWGTHVPVIHNPGSDGEIKTLLHRDLSRSGHFYSVPGGKSRSFVARPQGGIWAMLLSMFQIDPNIVEMYPTLVETDGTSADELTWRSGGDFWGIVSPSFSADGLSLGESEGDPLDDILGGSDKGTVRMRPAIVYRMKPHNPGSFALSRESVNNVYREKGWPLLKAKFTAERLKDGATPKAFSKPSGVSSVANHYYIPISDMSSLVLNLSEADRVNALSVRPFYDSTGFGYSFTSGRSPVYEPDKVDDYGFRHEEIKFDPILQDKRDHFAIAEYAYALLSLPAIGSMTGSCSCAYTPHLRAGQYVVIDGSEGGRTKHAFSLTCYVVSVRHSVVVNPDGSYRAETQIQFEQGSPGFGVPSYILNARPH